MSQREGHKNVIQEGDEYVCRACGRRWDATDERNGAVPTCTRTGEAPKVTHNISPYRSRTRKTYDGRYGSFKR
jgi:hypothetical protein